MTTKIIADMCNNHLGNKRILNTMVEHLASSMVDYVKFQLYNTNLLNPNYPNFEEYKSICKVCELGIDDVKRILSRFSWSVLTKPMFTIFSSDRLILLKQAIKELEFNNTWPTDIALKIGSPDMSNYKLIDACIEEFPENLVVISCGMHKEIEIVDCKSRYESNKNVKFLYCISEYPTDPRDINWGKLNNFDGFSDHTEGIDTAKRVILLGSEFLEFHFTLSKQLPGKDHKISKDIEDMHRITRFRESLINNENYKKRWSK